MIFHSLTLESVETRGRNPRFSTLRMLMNDKNIFDRYYGINSAQTKEIMVHHILQPLRISIIFIVVPGGLQFLIISTCFAWRPVMSISKIRVLTVRGMAGKFVDTSAIRKSNALLKKRLAYFQAAISYEYISETLCNLK